MRMIGIGLFGFLLAGVALLLSTMNIVERGQRYVREITTGPQLVFEHRTPALAKTNHTATLTRTNVDQPVILSGFPAYQSVAFAMPVDARPTSGYLQINATSQILDGVEGVLRISIRNTRRGEILLRPGEAGRALQVPLSPTDLAGPQLVVAFSLHGTGPQRQCGPEDGVAAVVEIETTSAIHLTLDAPLASVGDRVRAWGNTTHVSWPHRIKRDEQLHKLVLATQLSRRGLSAVFQPAEPDRALSIVDLHDLLETLSAQVQISAPDGRLTQSGPTTGLRRFHRKAVWRERYDLVGAAAQKMPKQLVLNMRLGALLGDQFWSLSVTLNGHFVFQSNVAGTQDELTAAIELSPDLHTAANTLEIIVTPPHVRMGPCDEGPERVAELLPTARLIAGDTPFTNPLVELQSDLRDMHIVKITLPDALSAVDADLAHALLSQVVPEETPIKPSMDGGHITVLAPTTQTRQLTVAGPAWLITTKGAAAGIAIQQLLPGDPLPPTGVALLVTSQPYATKGAQG